MAPRSRKVCNMPKAPEGVHPLGALFTVPGAISSLGAENVVPQPEGLTVCEAGVDCVVLGPLRGCVSG